MAVFDRIARTSSIGLIQDPEISDPPIKDLRIRDLRILDPESSEEADLGPVLSDAGLSEGVLCTILRVAT